MLRRQYHDAAGHELWLECDHDICRVIIISYAKEETSVELSILTTSIDDFGLPDRETILISVTVQLYRSRQQNRQCRQGSYAIPGSLNQDWINRLYFRLVRTVAKVE